LISGLPETLERSSIEIREAISGSVNTIIETVKDTLDEVPPEIISDLMDIGICLSGGGSLLLGMAERVSEDVKIRAWVAEDPMTCVARGAGLILEDFDNLKDWLIRIDEH
jgi:rod shape-determining protein MreB